MAARAYWQGQIRLALVSIPVEIYSATKSGAKIRFNQIHEPSGKRISYEKVVPGIGPVDRDEIIKGYEVSKGNYVLLDEDEIDAVRIESKRTLELVQFVDACEIDPLCSISKSPITSRRRTSLPRKPSSYCAKPCARRRRSRWASCRCAAARNWSR